MLAIWYFLITISGGTPCTEVKLNVVNLNKQGALYEHGMAPVSKTMPEPNRWERVRERFSFDVRTAHTPANFSFSMICTILLCMSSR